MLQSTYKWRKNAPAHFWAKADNARFCAYVLSHRDETYTNSLANSVDYCGTPSIGLYEGYLREAAIALELALKAGVATLNVEVPKTHDLGKLWILANVPKLEKVDTIRLRRFRMILEWSGRYATPTKEEYFLRDMKETVGATESLGKLLIEKPISLGWKHFDRLYSMAITTFIDKNRHPQNK